MIVTQSVVLFPQNFHAIIFFSNLVKTWHSGQHQVLKLINVSWARMQIWLRIEHFARAMDEKIKVSWSGLLKTWPGSSLSLHFSNVVHRGVNMSTGAHSGREGNGVTQQEAVAITTSFINSFKKIPRNIRLKKVKIKLTGGTTSPKLFTWHLTGSRLSLAWTCTHTYSEISCSCTSPPLTLAWVRACIRLT